MLISNSDFFCFSIFVESNILFYCSTAIKYIYSNPIVSVCLQSEIRLGRSYCILYNILLYGLKKFLCPRIKSSITKDKKQYNKYNITLVSNLIFIV